MKKERLFKALGEVDDTLIEEAASDGRPQKRPVPVRWISVACAAAVALTCVGLWQGGVFRPEVDKEPAGQTTQHSTTGTQTATEMAAQSTTQSRQEEQGETEKATTTKKANVSQQKTETEKTTGATKATGNPTLMGTTTRWPQVTVPVSRDEVKDDALEIVPKWDEKTLCQKFPELTYNGERYSAQHDTIKAADVGKALGNATLKGHDIYTDTDHTIEATVYTIKGIAVHCAVAVQFEKQADYYVYLLSWYVPDTLDDFINDLSLRENLTVGTVYSDTNVIENGVWSEVKFEGLSVNAIWDILFADTSLKNVEDFDLMWFDDTADRLWFEEVMTVGVSLPLLGEEGVITVTEGGYLTTNILRAGKAFFIGTERVRQFVDYVEQNCKGTEYIYISKTDDTTNVTTGDSRTVSTVVRTSQGYRPE